MCISEQFLFLVNYSISDYMDLTLVLSNLDNCLYLTKSSQLMAETKTGQTILPMVNYAAKAIIIGCMVSFIEVLNRPVF
jgi:hypothetical protein